MKIMIPVLTGIFLGMLTLATAQPQIVISGANGLLIPDGSSPSAFSPCNFGKTVVSTGRGAQFRITNTGTTTLTVTTPFTMIGANAGDFSTFNFSTLSIRPGNTQFISVIFTPSALGTRQATVVVTNNSPNPLYTFGVTGEGVNSLPDSVNLDVRPVKAPKTKLNKKTGHFEVSGSMEVTNTGELGMETGQATVFFSSTPFLSPTVVFPVQTFQLKALPPPTSKKLKRLLVKYKVDVGSNTSGAIFVRALATNGVDDSDLANNQEFDLFQAP